MSETHKVANTVKQVVSSKFLSQYDPPDPFLDRMFSAGICTFSIQKTPICTLLCQTQRAISSFSGLFWILILGVQKHLAKII
jgi:hypothetical protein